MTFHNSMDKLDAFFWSTKSDTYAKRIWLLFFTIVAVLAFFQPAQRNITHHYSRAVFNWWKSENMYSLQGKGFLYFPQSVLIYTPFSWQEFPKNLKEFNNQPLRETLMPTLLLRLGEVFYRAFLLGIFGWAIWRMCHFFKADASMASLFCLVTVLALPSSLTAGRNGQFNMLLSASMILAALSAAQKNWWATSAWLIFGLIAKPLGIVPLLLFGTLYRPLWGKLTLGVVVFAVLSFIHYDPSYVVHQWQMCIKQVTVASIPPGNNFDDIAAMFRTFGFDLPDKQWFPMRAAFAFITLGLAWRFRKIYPESIAPFFVMALSAAYLMVFNPRTETVSYLILSPYVALFAGLLIREKVTAPLVWILVFLCIGFGSDCYGDIYKITRIWFKPLLASIFFVLLGIWAFRAFRPFYSIKISV